MRDASTPILLFDGVCNLCHGAVQFILAHERAPQLRFAALQSEIGQQLLRDHHLPADYADSLVLIEGHRAYTLTTGALRLTRYLKFPYGLGRLALVIPAVLRDPFYHWIARHRYQWFGKKDQCLLPTPERKARFLDA